MTSIHPDTRLGPVHLAVSDLDRSLQFYGEVIGLRLLRQHDAQAILTADGATPLVALDAPPGARPKPPSTTGLYHFAVLMPGRADLARSLWRLLETRYPLQGASDHLVSEALYLGDPDGNGIELYADRPRDQWPRRNGRLQMATEPLDVEDLLRTLDHTRLSWTGLAPHTRVGHVHLHVADLRQAEAFYREVLGFELMQYYGRSAAFLSAGGYHHHIGLNTWAGVGAPPPPPDAVGLRFFTILLPDQAGQQRLAADLRDRGVVFQEQAGGIFVRDPSANGVLLTTA